MKNLVQDIYNQKKSVLKEEPAKEILTDTYFFKKTKHFKPLMKNGTNNNKNK